PAYVCCRTLVFGAGAIAGPPRLNAPALGSGAVPSSVSVLLTARSTIPFPYPTLFRSTLTLIGAAGAGPLANAGTLVVTTLDNTGVTAVSTLGGADTNTGTLRVLARPNANAQLDVPGSLTNAPGATVELTSGGSGPGAALLSVPGTLGTPGALVA